MICAACGETVERRATYGPTVLPSKDASAPWWSSEHGIFCPATDGLSHAEVEEPPDPTTRDSVARRPVLTDDRPLWMKRAWWLSTYLGTAGLCALRRDWPLWPRKGQRDE